MFKITAFGKAQVHKNAIWARAGPTFWLLAGASSVKFGTQMFETATIENFDPSRYLLANRDLRIAFGEDETMAKHHFHEHGIRENRQQLTAAFLSSQEFYNYRKMFPEISVFEPAIDGTKFHARGYLLANRDLRIAFGEDEALAERHFHERGISENRQQLTVAFLSSRREKFARFKETLSEGNGDSFPVNLAKRPHDISEYEAESSGDPPSFWVTELVNNPDGLYADVGAGLRRTVHRNCIYVEVYSSATADIIIDPDCRLPFRESSLDGVGCFAVLEHVDKPWVMASEIARVVKPGGKIFIDWPFLQPVHGYPSHFYNATREGLRSLFADKFEIDELCTGVWEGPDYTVNWILNTLLKNIKNDSIRTKLLNTTIGDLCDQLPQGDYWKSVLRTLDDHAISTLSCGNWLVAVKK